MAILLPYFVTIEKEKEMSHPTFTLVGRRRVDHSHIPPAL